MLAKIHCNPTSDLLLRKQARRTKHRISVELSNPNTFIQSLLKLGSFLHGKTIKFLDNPINYPPVILAPWSTPTIPMKTTVEIEEHRKNTTFDQNYHLKQRM
ncbi:hypothetical protein HpDR4_07600 [Helicobacter pylori]